MPAWRAKKSATRIGEEHHVSRENGEDEKRILCSSSRGPRRSCCRVIVAAPPPPPVGRRSTGGLPPIPGSFRSVSAGECVKVAGIQKPRANQTTPQKHFRSFRVFEGMCSIGLLPRRCQAYARTGNDDVHRGTALSLWTQPPPNGMAFFLEFKNAAVRELVKAADWLGPDQQMLCARDGRSSIPDEKSQPSACPAARVSPGHRVVPVPRPQDLFQRSAVHG